MVSTSSANIGENGSLDPSCTPCDLATLPALWEGMLGLLLSLAAGLLGSDLAEVPVLVLVLPRFLGIIFLATGMSS